MSQLKPEIAAQVVEACKTAAADVASAFQRAFDREVTLSVGEPDTVDHPTLCGTIAGAGLAIVLTVGDEAALVLLDESSGLLPSWYANPDKTGRAKLDTLAQELAYTLLPEDATPEEFAAVSVAGMAEVITQAQLAEVAARVPLRLEAADGMSAVAQFVWPASNPSGVKPAGAPPADVAEPPAQKASEPAKAKPAAAATPSEPARQNRRSVHELPHYTRSLLKINVPVVVTLARKSQPLGKILELGPGSIIQFDKSYEETLELDVGGRPVATGEAVKVGEKFGLRISSIVMPGERFRRIQSAAATKK